MIRDANGNRLYVPKVGDRVRFRHLGLYGSRGLHGWARMKVIGVVGRLVSLQVLNGDQETDQQTAADCTELDPPIGWKPVHDIHCDMDKVDQVLGWFERGIRVKVDHALDRMAGDCFTPMDVDVRVAPTWGYYMADEVGPFDCPQVFNVWAYKAEMFHMPKDAKVRKNVKRALAAKGWEVWANNHGVYGTDWFRSKSVLVHSVDRPGERLQTSEEIREQLTAPQTSLDVLWRLEKECRPEGLMGDAETAWERERIDKGECISRWVLYRAALHVDGRLENGGNSTWMYDPEAKGDPVKRG